MKKSHFLILLGISTAAGTTLGMIAERRNPSRGGLLGAAAGLIAGSVAAGVYQYIESNRIPYYSSESDLYDDLDLI